MKKTLSLILCMVIVLSSLCMTTVMAESGTNEVTVYVTISKHGEIISDKNDNLIAMTPVLLSDKSSYTLDDVFLSVHNELYDAGEAGYESKAGDYGPYVSKFWDDESGNFTYQVNFADESVWGLSHEIESGKSPKSEKAKLKRIQEIEAAGFDVKRIIVNWSMTESEAFAAEAALINMLSFLSADMLTNAVAGHHVHEAMTVEDFDLLYGAEHLKQEDIQHSIMVIKINKLYRKGMNPKEQYDIVRGNWRASMASIQKRNVEYVFGVYNQLIVAVYKPDEWHYVHDRIDVPQIDDLDEETLERGKDRVYFVCKDYERLDQNQQFYLHKSIADLKVNQSSQNPITYLTYSK